MRACRPKEVFRLVQHAVAGETVLVDFEVTGFENAGVFLYLFEVGVHAALSRLVCDDRYVDSRLFAAIPVGRGLALVDSDPLPVRITRVGGDMRGIELVRFHMRAGCGSGIEVARVVGPTLPDEVFEDSKVAFVLVAVAVEDEGGMVAVFI